MKAYLPSSWKDMWGQDVINNIQIHLTYNKLKTDFKFQL